jgi:hypothetical protein
VNCVSITLTTGMPGYERIIADEVRAKIFAKIAAKMPSTLITRSGSSREMSCGRRSEPGSSGGPSITGCRPWARRSRARG